MAGSVGSPTVLHPNTITPKIMMPVKKDSHDTQNKTDLTRITGLER